MATGTFSWLFAVYAALSFCFFVSVTDSQTDRCLACSYTFAADGKTDLECVTNATYFKKSFKIPCDFTTRRCSTIAVYTENYGKLTSLTRSCQVPPPGGVAKPCDDGSIPRCQKFCKGDLCNKEHGDIHAALTTGDDGKNGVASLELRGNWAVWLIFSGIFFGVCL